MEIIDGVIKDWEPDGTIHIDATVKNLDVALKRKYSRVQVAIDDGRRITPEQRRKVYAILGEISDYVNGYRDGDALEETKATMKMDFMLKRMESMERRLFSLSDCSVTTARAFIDYLISFVIANNIPTKVPLIEQCEDVSRYIYSCLVNKKCCICGKPADLHHVQSVGSQGYRDKINHIGLEALPLCREHHISLHSMGNKEFIEKWHLEPVRIDAKIAKLYKLNKGK